MSLADQPLPILWTGDFIPADGPNGSTVYIVGEFNCSCVGISNFGKGCGEDKDLTDVTDENFAEGTRLTTLIGKKAVEALDEMKNMPKQPAAGGRVNALKAQPGSPKYKLAHVGFE